jgi:hypothetical protein
MVESDIIDWSLTIAVHGMPSASLLGPLSGNNSIISLFSSSSDMVATSVGLFFNFATPGAAVFFGGTDGAAHSAFVLAYPYVNYPTGIEWSYGGSATQLTQVMI